MSRWHNEIFEAHTVSGLIAVDEHMDENKLRISVVEETGTIDPNPDAAVEIGPLYAVALRNALDNWLGRIA